MFEMLSRHISNITHIQDVQIQMHLTLPKSQIWTTAPVTNLSLILALEGFIKNATFKEALSTMTTCVTVLRQKNPQTQAFACPDGFEKVLLHEETTHGAQQQHKCDSCFIFFDCCHGQSYYASATYTSYWCRAKPNSIVQQDSGFLFGGLYSDRINNFVTQTKSCPQYFIPMMVASNIRVCTSDDYELDGKFAVPFGGFYSCQNGNPLTNRKKSCPKSLATILYDCEIEYCV